MGAFARKSVIYVTADAVLPAKPEAGVQYIAIKSKLSLGEKADLEGALLHIDADAGRPEIRTSTFLRMANRVAIVDWYLLDEKGQPVPFSPDLIDELDPTDPLVDKALGEWAKVNPLRIAPTARTSAG